MTVKYTFIQIFKKCATSVHIYKRGGLIGNMKKLVSHYLQVNLTLDIEIKYFDINFS